MTYRVGPMKEAAFGFVTYRPGDQVDGRTIGEIKWMETNNGPMVGLWEVDGEERHCIRLIATDHREYFSFDKPAETQA